MLIAVWGAAPGIGKSTLCASLSNSLAQAGLRVDHFAEEDIMVRPEFTPVARHFEATGRVEPGMLLAATTRFAATVLGSGHDVVVADAFVPFVPSLLAMRLTDEQIGEFAADLTSALKPVYPVLMFLDGSPGAALARASAREGPGWLDWYLGKLARYDVTPQVRDLASAERYLRRERDVTLTAVRRSSWPTIIIEHATSLSPADVLEAVRLHLDEVMAGRCCLNPCSSDNAVPLLSLEQQLRSDVAVGDRAQQQRRDGVAAHGPPAGHSGGRVVSRDAEPAC